MLETRYGPCKLCGGSGRLALYADRPDRCYGCGGSGETGFVIVEVGPGHFRWYDVPAQTGLFEEAG